MAYGIVLIAWKRLWSRLGLTLLSLLGVVLAISLATNIPVFSHAVDLAILRKQLNEASTVAGRPPFSVEIYYFPSPKEPLSLERAERFGRHFGHVIASRVQLPLKQVALQVESRGMQLQPRSDDAQYDETQPTLGSVRTVFRPDMSNRIEIVAGDQMDGGTSSGDIDVWMHSKLANQMGVHIGEAFDLVPGREETRLPVRIAGIWKARDADEPLWLRDPSSAYSGAALLIRRQDYVTHVQPHLTSKTGFVSWYVVLDDRAIRPQRAETYVEGLEQGIRTVKEYLPRAQMGGSPLTALQKFLGRKNILMTLLLSFSVPSWGFLLYFLILISAIIGRWQRAETAVMVSRGIGRFMLFVTTLGEGLIICALGLPLGIGAGLGLARLMGRARSFLSFNPGPPLPVSLDGINFTFVAAAIGAFLVARVLVILQAAKHSVVTDARTHFRPLQKPFWRRYYVDLLLAVPLGYAYSQLIQVGALGRLVQESPTDLYKDPLLILVPALFVLEASLLSMRVFPLLMRVASWLSALSPWSFLHFSFRQLSRRSPHYTNALLLVIATLSLGGYMASMATSLDQWLVDRMYYRAGADARFQPYVKGEEEEQVVEVAPVSEYLEIQGVEKATRVGEYPVEICTTGGCSRRGRFLAVDRLEFPQVAAFRSDFASASLGELMNRLALHPEGILVSREFLAKTHLREGDQIQLRVGLGDMKLNDFFTVVGVYDYFPTVYEDEIALVGNLEYLFNEIGGPFIHHVWMRTNPAWDRSLFRDVLQDRAMIPLQYLNAKERIEAEREKWERVGVFGTLSIGFLAAAAMAEVGLLVYDYASLQERVYHFAILRAVGLDRRRLIGQVALEYGALTIYGAGIGLLIGLLASRLFIPFFRVAEAQGVPRPPLLPIIAWGQMVPMTVGFAAGMILIQVTVIIVAVRRGVLRALRMGQ